MPRFPLSTSLVPDSFILSPFLKVTQAELDDPANNARRKNFEILKAYASQGASGKTKKFIIHFLTSPAELVGSGKLGESWETDLANVEISNRRKVGYTEYVVSFRRSTGDPKTVYIFFTADGKYSGSNFTGK